MKNCDSRRKKKSLKNSNRFLPLLVIDMQMMWYCQILYSCVLIRGKLEPGGECSTFSKDKKSKTINDEHDAC